MPEIVLGLDVGSRYIKAAFVKLGKVPRVVGAFVAKTPGGGVMDGEIAFLDAIAEVVAQKIEEAGLKLSGLAACINSPNIITRYLTLPALPPAEIPSAVRFEILKLFPSIKDTHIITQKVLSSDDSSVVALAALCPSELIEKYRELASRLNLPLKYADVRSNAQVRAISRFCARDGEDTGNAAGLIVDIGHGSSMVSVVSRGKLTLSRYVTNGAASYDNLLSGIIGASTESIENARISGDLANIASSGANGRDFADFAKSDEAAQMMDLCFYDINEQIRQTVGFFANDKSGMAPAYLDVIGEGGSIPDVERYFGRKHGLEIRKLSLTESAGANFIKYKIRDNPKLLYAAIGAALGGMDGADKIGGTRGTGEAGGGGTGDGGGRDINFVDTGNPGKRKLAASARLTAAAAAMLILLAAAAGTAYYYASERNGALAEINRINTVMTRDKQISKQSDEIAEARARLSELSSVIGAIEAGSLPATEILGNLTAEAPEGLFAVNVNILDLSRITLSGRAKDYEDISEYALRLRQTRLYDGVRINSITANQAASAASADYGYSMTITLK